MDNINKPITFHWMWRRHWQITDSLDHLDFNGIMQMAKELDGAGVKSVLLPYGPTGIDFSLVISEALKATNQLIMTIALPAFGTSPDYAAKIVDTLNWFGPGRIGVNLVAGRWGDEGNGPSEKLVLDHYMHDSSLIDTLEKRVAVSAVWMNNFMNLMKRHKHKTHMAVVGSSDTTISIANKHCEYIYVDDNLIYRDQFKKIDLNKVKPILIIDPLIMNHPDEEQSVKYDKNAPVRKQHHHVKGTQEEIVRQIRDLSNQFNIYDFMIHTDQADISHLLKLVKEFN
jgi:alkanesulfonate monooxygenase SsuD/methylene tetrahydromethanopterin reductase-like flavin-dependent oxidoreductase (luciferase family)